MAERKPDPPWYASNLMMLRAGFTYDLMRRSTIWAAKYRECPICGAPPGKPCLNKNDIKNRATVIRRTRNPHPLRVDWRKLEQALRDKGYDKHLSMEN